MKKYLIVLSTDNTEAQSFIAVFVKVIVGSLTGHFPVIRALDPKTGLFENPVANAPTVLNNDWLYNRTWICVCGEAADFLCKLKPRPSSYVWFDSNTNLYESLIENVFTTIFGNDYSTYKMLLQDKLSVSELIHIWRKNPDNQGYQNIGDIVNQVISKNRHVLNQLHYLILEHEGHANINYSELDPLTVHLFQKYYLPNRISDGLSRKESIIAEAIFNAINTADTRPHRSVILDKSSVERACAYVKRAASKDAHMNEVLQLLIKNLI